MDCLDGSPNYSASLGWASGRGWLWICGFSLQNSKNSLQWGKATHAVATITYLSYWCSAIKWTIQGRQRLPKSAHCRGLNLFPQVFLSFSQCFLDIDSVHSNKEGKHLHQSDKSSKVFVLHPWVHTASLSSESQMGTPNRVRQSRKKNINGTGNTKK